MIELLKQKSSLFMIRSLENLFYTLLSSIVIAKHSQSLLE